MNWVLKTKARAAARIRNIPDEGVQAGIRSKIERMLRDPGGSASKELRAPTRTRKVRRIAEADWRVICVLLPEKRRLHVVDAFERHSSPDDYSEANIRRWLRTARDNPGILRALLNAHPDWSDEQVAREAGCSDTTVARWRHAWGVPPRHDLPWKPWEKSHAT